MVFYTILLFQALHTSSILLSAAVTLSIIHNVDFAMLSMQLAQTQTPWLLCFGIKILYQFLTPWQSLSEYLQFQRYKFHPLLFEEKGTLTFGTALLGSG